jgi:hypothetical protein
MARAGTWVHSNCAHCEVLNQVKAKTRPQEAQTSGLARKRSRRSRRRSEGEKKREVGKGVCVREGVRRTRAGSDTESKGMKHGCGGGGGARDSKTMAWGQEGGNAMARGQEGEMRWLGDSKGKCDGTGTRRGNAKARARRGAWEHGDEKGRKQRWGQGRGVESIKGGAGNPSTATKFGKTPHRRSDGWWQRRRQQRQRRRRRRRLTTHLLADRVRRSHRKHPVIGWRRLCGRTSRLGLNLRAQVQHKPTRQIRQRRGGCAGGREPKQPW